jgi:hypothetical protein
MTLHDPRLERELRRRARAEVCESPRLRAARRVAMPRRSRQAPPWVFRLVPAPLVFGFLASMQSAGWPSESRFAAAAFLLAAMHSFQWLAFRTFIVSNPDIGPLWHFCADERLAFRWVWRIWWRRPLWAAYDAAWALAGLDAATQGVRAGWGAVAILSALYGLLSIGWLCRPWAWFDKSCVMVVGLGIVTQYALHSAGSPSIGSILATFEPVALAFPSGWLVRAMAGWRGDSGYVWVAAFGAVVAGILSCHVRFRTQWRQWLDSTWAGMPIERGGDSEEKFSDEDEETVCATTAVSPTELAECTDAVLAGEYRQIEPEVPPWRVSRWIASWLTPRELVLVGAFGDGVPDYLARWGRWLRLQLKYWIVASALHWFGFDAAKNVTLACAAISLLGVLPFASFLPRMRQSSGLLRGSPELGALLPVSLREVTVLERKLGLPLWLGAVPVFGTCGAAAGVAAGAPGLGALWGVKAVAVLAAAHPLIRSVALIERTIRKGCAFLLGVMACIIVSAAGAGAFMFAPTPWNIGGLATVWIIGSLVWMSYQRLWRRVRTDAFGLQT